VYTYKCIYIHIGDLCLFSLYTGMGYFLEKYGWDYYMSIILYGTVLIAFSLILPVISVDLGSKLQLLKKKKVD
jgi:hypothetical protein